MPRNRPLTRQDLESFSSHLSDHQIAEILATKATVGEFTEARQWIASDDTPGMHNPRSPKVKRICEILETALPDLEE